MFPTSLTRTGDSLRKTLLATQRVCACIKLPMASETPDSPLPLNSPLVETINDAVRAQVKACGIDEYANVLKKYIDQDAPEESTNPNYYVCYAAYIPIDLRKPISFTEFSWDPEKERFIKIAQLLSLSTSSLDLLGSRSVARENIIPFRSIDLNHESICQLMHPVDKYKYMKEAPDASADTGLAWNHRAQCVLNVVGIETNEPEDTGTQTGKKSGWFSSLFGASKSKASAVVGIDNTKQNFDCTIEPVFTTDCVLVLNGGAGNALIKALARCDVAMQYKVSRSQPGASGSPAVKKGPIKKIKPPSMPLVSSSASLLMQELGGETQVRNGLKSIFGQYDSDGDGHIDTDELFSMMIELHIIAETEDSVETPDIEVAKSVMTALDTNKNGTLELSEFENWMAKGIQQSTKALGEFKTLGPQYEQLHNFLVAVVQQLKTMLVRT